MQLLAQLVVLHEDDAGATAVPQEKHQQTPAQHHTAASNIVFGLPQGTAP